MADRDIQRRRRRNKNPAVDTHTPSVEPAEKEAEQPQSEAHSSGVHPIQSLFGVVVQPEMRPLLLSGAAKGADVHFGGEASRSGHQVVHWSFEGHRHCVRDSSARQLVFSVPDRQLSDADPALRIAARSLGKSPPTRPFVASLLRRNWLQVRWADAVYCVTWMDLRDQTSQLRMGGGTAWAAQMYVDRFQGSGTEDPSSCRLFFFEVNSKRWLRWEMATNQWTKIREPPKPHGVYAGIGTRELTPEGRDAINKLFAK